MIVNLGLRNTIILITIKTQGRIRDSSIGIVTSYGLDGQGSFPGKGKIFLFSIASKLAWGLTSGYWGLFNWR
jgi:hypothetical protein